MTTMMINEGATLQTNSVEKVLNEGGLISNIMSNLLSAQDWYALSLASKAWHDAVIGQASKLVVRRRSSLRHIVKLFRHIHVLDLSGVSEELEDGDLELCAESFENLHSLTLGQECCPSKITNAGVLAFAAKHKLLEHLKFVNILGLEEAGLRAFGIGCPNLRSLSLVACDNLTDSAIGAICEFHALVALELSGPFPLVTAQGFVRMGCGCPNLLKLRLPKTFEGIQQTTEAIAKGCPKLQEVHIGFETILLDPLAQYCKCLTTLTVELDTRRVLLDDRILQICNANKNLKELVLCDHESQLSNDSITEIILGLKLEKFHLAAGHRLSAETVQCIASCPSLRDLTLEGIPDSGFWGFGQCRLSAELQSLALIDCYLESLELEAMLFRNRDLKRLDLRQCRRVGLQGFSTIAQCRHLQVLDLAFTTVNDESLIAIAGGLQALKRLTLKRCRAIRSMEAVASFRTLETLDVESCRFVSNHSLEILASRCPLLLHLDVGGTVVTDEGLVHLSGCSLLRSLRVAFCRYVRGPGLVRMAKSCLCFEHVTLSHTFDKSRIVEELKEQLCGVSLEWDTDSDGQIENTFARFY